MALHRGLCPLLAAESILPVTPEEVLQCFIETLLNGKEFSLPLPSLVRDSSP